MKNVCSTFFVFFFSFRKIIVAVYTANKKEDHFFGMICVPVCISAE